MAHNNKLRKQTYFSRLGKIIQANTRKISIVLVTLVALFTNDSFGQSNLLKGDSDVEFDTLSMTCGPFTLPSSWKWDQTSGFNSSSSIVLPDHGGVGIDSLKLPVGKYTFSYWARSERPGARAYITANIQDSGWPKALKNRASSPVALTTEWKRYSFTFTADGNSFYSPYFGSDTGSGACWFDRFMLNAGDNPLDWEPGSDFTAMILIPAGDGKVYPYSQPVTVKAVLVNHFGKEPEGAFNVRVVDHYGNTVVEHRLIPEFDSDGKYSFPLTIPAGKSGWFGIKTSMKGIPTNTVSLVMVRPPEQIADGIEPFVGLCGAEKYIGAAKLIGVNWLEAYFRWLNVEPSRGVYRFEDFDKFRKYKDAGFKVKLLITSNGMPAWMQSREEAKKAAEFKLSYFRFLPPADKLEVEWRNLIANLVKKYRDVFDIYELGGELDALVGLNTYYKSLDPENTVGPFVLGESLERVAKQMNIAAEEILKAVPDARIGGCRPSDVDSRHSYAYSKEFYKLCGKNLNIFGIDCYPQPRWIGPGLPPTGSDRDLETRYKDALSVMKGYGKGTDVFISEYGYFIDHREINNPQYTLEQVNRLARSFLKAKVLGFKSLFWLGTEQLDILEGKHYYMGIWKNGYPLPAVAALSAVSRVVENVSECAEMPMDKADISAAVYRKSDGRAVGAIWSVNPDFSPFAAFDADKMEITDVMGNPVETRVENGKVLLRLSEQPYYLWRAEKGEDNYSALKQSIGNLKIHEDIPAELSFRCGAKNTLKVYMKNTSVKNEHHGVIEFSYAEKSGKTDRFTLPVGGTSIVTIPLPNPGEKISITFKFEGEYRPFETEFTTPELIKIPNARNVRFEEAPGNWTGANTLTISGRDHIMPLDHTTFDGDDDLSARVYLAHDGEFLYFGAEVTDDRHFNNAAKSNIWRGDCLQLGFDPKNDYIRKVNDMDSDDCLMTLALLSTGPELSVHRAQNRTAIAGKTKYNVIRDEKVKKTVYTMKIPLSAIDSEMKKDAIFGFNFVVMDDDSGSGPDYWLFLKQGLAGGLRPDKFAKCIIE